MITVVARQCEEALRAVKVTHGKGTVRVAGTARTVRPVVPAVGGFHRIVVDGSGGNIGQVAQEGIQIRLRMFERDLQDGAILFRNDTEIVEPHTGAAVLDGVRILDVIKKRRRRISVCRIQKPLPRINHIICQDTRAARPITLTQVDRQGRRLLVIAVFLRKRGVNISVIVEREQRFVEQVHDRQYGIIRKVRRGIKPIHTVSQIDTDLRPRIRFPAGSQTERAAQYHCSKQEQADNPFLHRKTSGYCLDGSHHIARRTRQKGTTIHYVNLYHIIISLLLQEKTTGGFQF